MVLGVQWLITLGPILWDFSNLRMEFSLNGNKHILRGVTKTDCKLIKSSSLNKLIIKGPQISILQISGIKDSKSPTLDSYLLQFAAGGNDMNTDHVLIDLLVTPVLW